MLIFQSLWNRYRPGVDPIGQAIRTRQWTALHLTPAQLAAGIIPLTHSARVLLFDRPLGPTQIHVGGHTYPAERIAHSLVIPPALLTAPIIQLRHTDTGFLLNQELPNVTATTHLVAALRQAGWSSTTDPFDDDGTHIIPALLRATATYPAIRTRPTLPLTLVSSLLQHANPSHESPRQLLTPET